MKKILLPLFAFLLLIGCEKEQVVTSDSEAELDFRAAGVDVKIWPPDGGYETLTIEDMFPGLTDDYAGDLNAATIVIDEASSDELEDDPSTQDGSTTDDIVIAVDCQSIQLRRERMNAGNGRVYTVSLSITDGSGTTPAEYVAAVPRWPWGWYSNAVDDGSSYVVSGDCGGGGCSTDGLLEVTVINTGSETYTLYVHPTDNSTGIAWGGFGTATGASSDFDGAANTSTIVTTLGAGVYAAKLCDDLVGPNGCDDWYLPAKEELDAMYQQLGPGGNNNFTNNFYWSSTELDAFDAWGQYFGIGNQVFDYKFGLPRCRCVRR